MDDMELMLGDWQADGQMDRIQTYARAGEFIEKRIARKKGKDCDDDLELSDILAGLIDQAVMELNPVVIVVEGAGNESSGVSA